mgnify:CR=1 FL=1
MSFVILFVLLVFLFNKLDSTICFSIAFYPLLSLIRVTDSINLFQVFSIFAVCLFFLKSGKKQLLKMVDDFPFSLTIIMFVISFVVTNLQTSPHWPTSIALLFSEYIMVYVFWIVMHKRENIHIFLSMFTLFIAIITGYCIIEFLLQKNPLYDWYVNSSLFMGYDADRSEDIRFGSMRCHSLMRDVGALGTVCCLGICVFFSFFQMKDNVTALKKYFYLGLIVLCFVSTFFTGTRTAILGIIFCLIVCTFSLNNKNRIRLLTIVLLFCILGSGLIYDVYLSFVDTKSVQGSSTDMRELQWAVVLQAFNSSPIFGWGLEGTSLVMNRFEGAFGLESVWFQILINYGLLGAAAFTFSLFQGFLYSIRNKCIPAIAVAGMFLMVKTMSSIPGVGNGYFLYIIVYLIMYQKLMRNEEIKVGHSNNA